MTSVNKIILVGNLGADPETRYMPSGEAVTNVSLATTEHWKDKQSGEPKERTEWWKVEFWGRLAEIAGEYLRKGSPIYVEGSGYTQKWTDRDGIDRYTFKVRAKNLCMLGGRRENSADSPAQQKAPAERASCALKKEPSGKFDDMEDDDIPFTSCNLSDDVIFGKLRWPIE